MFWGDPARICVPASCTYVCACMHVHIASWPCKLMNRLKRPAGIDEHAANLTLELAQFQPSFRDALGNSFPTCTYAISLTISMQSNNMDQSTASTAITSTVTYAVSSATSYAPLAATNAPLASANYAPSAATNYATNYASPSAATNYATNYAPPSAATNYAGNYAPPAAANYAHYGPSAATANNVSNYTQSAVVPYSGNYPPLAPGVPAASGTSAAFNTSGKGTSTSAWTADLNLEVREPLFNN